MRKKIFTIIMLLMIVLSMALMTACGEGDLGGKLDPDKHTIVCTGYAQYDWVLNILGDKAADWNVIRINDKGADMHSYQPAAEDMIILYQCDAIIYVGGLSENWITEVVTAPGYEGVAYPLLENTEAILMEEEHDHEAHGAHDGHDHDSEEFDEHVWLSPKNAIKFCEDIAKIAAEVDPENSEVYEANCESYIEQLEELCHKYEEAVGLSYEDYAADAVEVEGEEATPLSSVHAMGEETAVADSHAHESHESKLIFADRFPFRYLARDYDLVWHAAFPGCSAETEASFDTIKELAAELKSSGVRRIFVTESGTDDLANTIIQASGCSGVEIVCVNSMQSVSADEETSYIEIMEANLEALFG